MDDIPNILVTAFSAIGLGMGFVGWLMIVLYGRRIDIRDILMLNRKLVWSQEPRNSKLSDIGLGLVFAEITVFGLTALITLAIYPDGLRTP